MKKDEAKFLGHCLSKLQQGIILSRNDAKRAFLSILENDTKLSNFYWGSLFAGIKTRRKNDVNESLGLVDAILEYDHALPTYLSTKRTIQSNNKVVSITGSGKETFKTFNVSTAAAIVAACCDVTVIKPGSRSTSAFSGATDILLEMGLTIYTDLDKAKKSAEETGLCFVDYSNLASKYAKRYDELFYHFHPLSYIVPPLYIPFKVDTLLYGISDSDVCHSATLLKHFNYSNAGVVFGDLGEFGVVDEATPQGKTKLARIENGNIMMEEYTNNIRDNYIFEIKQKDNHIENSKMLIASISGTGSEHLVNLVSYNTAILLNLANSNVSIEEGTEKAKDAIYSGKALEKIKEYKEYSADMENLKEIIR